MFRSHAGLNRCLVLVFFFFCFVNVWTKKCYVSVINDGIRSKQYINHNCDDLKLFDWSHFTDKECETK